MAVTEITKILFRRGKESDRRRLEDFGGLANGEPGFTGSGGWEDGSYFPSVAPTLYHRESTFLNSEDVIQYSATLGGGDFFMGGPGGKDIYIGGSSAEKHWQRYFVSLSGTDWNNNGDVLDTNYINGDFRIGKAAVGVNDSSRHLNWDVEFYGVQTSGNTVPQKLLYWEADTGQLQVNSSSALKIPCGDVSERPGDMATSGVAALSGMIRYNVEYKAFEGYNGENWGSLGGAMSIDRKTYITLEKPVADTADCGTSGGDEGGMHGKQHNITFVTNCGKVGFFDQTDFHVVNDIVAFSTSDRRQKSNVVNIDDPLGKLQQLNGVTFDWNTDNAPNWVKDSTRHDVGVLAQEVEDVLPMAVTEREDGYKAVDYKRLVPLLIESVKQLAGEVQDLKKQLENNSSEG